MDELLPDALARLSATVETLECRVYALEHPASNQQAPSQSEAIESPAAIPRTTSSPQSAGIFSVVGKAMLGIAGAYLLRAMAESTTFPRAVVVPVALSYAAMWLVAATRVKTEAKFASIAYAGTSVLILIPMLWELTLRFNFFSAAMAATVLGAFVVASFFLAWRRHFAAVTWVTTAACSTAALIMAIATHDLVPFILAILAMTVASEAAAAHDRSSFIRFWVAISADVAVCALIYIASRTGGFPHGLQTGQRVAASSDWSHAVAFVRRQRNCANNTARPQDYFLRGIANTRSILAGCLEHARISLRRRGRAGTALPGGVRRGLWARLRTVRSNHTATKFSRIRGRQRRSFSSGCLPVTAHDLADYRACHSCDRGNYSWSSNRASYLGISRLDVSLGGRVLFWPAALYRSRLHRRCSYLTHWV